MRDGVVIDYLVACWQNENLFLFAYSFPLCYQDFDIRQGLTCSILSCFIAQCDSSTLLTASYRHFNWYPFDIWVSYKVDFIDGGSIFLAVSDLQIKPVSEIDDFVDIFGLFRYLCEQFKTRNPFLF